MKLKDKNISKESRKWSISIFLYVVASVVALVGVALLIDNIYIFRNTVNQYATKGYPTGTVIKQLIPQLLPQIFEQIAVYGGIAFVLFGVGKVNKKVSKCLILLTKVDDCEDIIGESTLEPNIADTEITKQTETEDLLKKPD